MQLGNSRVHRSSKGQAELDNALQLIGACREKARVPEGARAGKSGASGPPNFARADDMTERRSRYVTAGGPANDAGALE